MSLVKALIDYELNAIKILFTIGLFLTGLFLPMVWLDAHVITFLAVCCLSE